MPEVAPAPLNRGMVTVFVILATLLQVLDTTIANVALPYMQGSVAASQDQIAWVLTSYIAAAAIMTPPTGFLASRFGARRLFLVSVAGFTAMSVLCGISESLGEIVIFRILQGFFGAALVPLSQSTLMAINPREKQGSAMALFGVAVMIGPILGPVLGGWLTQSYSWRWVFYINVPLGIAAFVGLGAFMPAAPPQGEVRLDRFGFGTLSLAIAAFQVALDRGEQLDWFSSGEIVVESVLAASAFYLFLAHSFTTRAPFIAPALFRDRNFSAGTVCIAVVGMTYYASLALQPPYLQTLMDYPVVTAGLVMGPRGFGTMASMFLVGRLIGRIDTRILLAVGVGMTAMSFFLMTGWTPAISRWTIVAVGIFQGAGLGFLFVPLSTVALATLSAADRTAGAGIFSLARNVGSSVGISIVNALLTSDTQVNHAEIARYVTPTNPGFADAGANLAWSPFSPAGRAALDAMVTRQSSIIAYVDDYKLLMVATIAVFPVVLLFRKPGAAPAPDPHAMAVD